MAGDDELKRVPRWAWPLGLMGWLVLLGSTILSALDGRSVYLGVAALVLSGIGLVPLARRSLSR
jgi:hypothetical protein